MKIAVLTHNKLNRSKAHWQIIQLRYDSAISSALDAPASRELPWTPRWTLVNSDEPLWKDHFLQFIRAESRWRETCSIRDTSRTTTRYARVSVTPRRVYTAGVLYTQRRVAGDAHLYLLLATSRMHHLRDILWRYRRETCSSVHPFSPLPLYGRAL